MTVNDNISEVQRLAELITKVIDREAKKRTINAAFVCAALGTAAAAVVGTAFPDANETVDATMLGLMIQGFGLVGALRRAKTN